MTTETEPTLRLVPADRDDTLARLYVELEQHLFDDERTPLDRLRPALELIAATCLGAIAASAAMFILFLVVNNIFHYQP